MIVDEAIVHEELAAEPAPAAAPGVQDDIIADPEQIVPDATAGPPSTEKHAGYDAKARDNAANSSASDDELPLLGAAEGGVHVHAADTSTDADANADDDDVDDEAIPQLRSSHFCRTFMRYLICSCWAAIAFAVGLICLCLAYITLSGRGGHITSGCAGRPGMDSGLHWHCHGDVRFVLHLLLTLAAGSIAHLAAQQSHVMCSLAMKRSTVCTTSMAAAEDPCTRVSRRMQRGGRPMSRPLRAGTYWLTRIVFTHMLGGLFFVGFGVAAMQNAALLGSSGLLPYADKLRTAIVAGGKSSTTPFASLPTLLWLLEAPTDGCLLALELAGLILSLVPMCLGRCSSLLVFALWALYFSVVSVGGDFYAFGWESQLLETASTALLLWPLLPALDTATDPTFASLPRASAQSIAGDGVPLVVLAAQRWLLFRIMLGAGLIKARGDQCWRDCTCMLYHYETQPNPGPLSWHLHHMPRWWHVLETGTNHVVELLLPWLMLAPALSASLSLFLTALLAMTPLGRSQHSRAMAQSVRHSAHATSRCATMFCGVFQIGFQFLLICSGNLSFLNWLTIAPAIWCFDDRALAVLFSARTRGQIAILQNCAEPNADRQKLEPCAWTRQSMDDIDDSDHDRQPPPRGPTLLEAVSYCAVVAVALVCALFVLSSRITSAAHIAAASLREPRTDLRPAIWNDVLNSVEQNAVDILHVFGVLASMLLIAVALASWKRTGLGAKRNNAGTIGRQLPSVRTARSAAFSVVSELPCALLELGVATAIALLSIPVVANMLSPSQRMLGSYDWLRLVNTYGAFGSVTKERMEVVLEGTADNIETGTPPQAWQKNDNRNMRLPAWLHLPFAYGNTPTWSGSNASLATWQEYEFKCKPTSLVRRPCLITPWHYRLDWVWWFLPFDAGRMRGAPPSDWPRWFAELQAWLLTSPRVPGASRVRQLLDSDPFATTTGPGAPRFVRTLLYRYRYTLPEQKARTGAYWRRSHGTVLTPPVSLTMLYERGFGRGSLDPKAGLGNAFTGQLVVMLATMGLVASVAPFRSCVKEDEPRTAAAGGYCRNHVASAAIMDGGGSHDCDSGTGARDSATVDRDSAKVEIELTTRLR